jgi:hypothetical protein
MYLRRAVGLRPPMPEFVLASEASDIPAGVITPTAAEGLYSYKFFNVFPVHVICIVNNGISCCDILRVITV